MSMDLFLATQLLEAGWAINSMKTEAEAAAQLDEEAMLEALGEISRQGLEADTAIRAAFASLYPSPDLADEFETWVKRAYRDAYEATFTVYNMEVAWHAGRAAALASLPAASKE